MSNTIRQYKGVEYDDKSKKKKPERKSFVFRDENHLTKANGGPGNKRGWKIYIPTWLYKKYKKEENIK